MLVSLQQLCKVQRDLRWCEPTGCVSITMSVGATQHWLSEGSEFGSLPPLLRARILSCIPAGAGHHPPPASGICDNQIQCCRSRNCCCFHLVLQRFPNPHCCPLVLPRFSNPHCCCLLVLPGLSKPHCCIQLVLPRFLNPHSALVAQLNIRLLLVEMGCNKSMCIICQQSGTLSETKFEDSYRLPLGFMFNMPQV